jgi:hypothetical protein
MPRQLTPEQQARKDEGAQLVQTLAETIRRTKGEERDTAIEILRIVQQGQRIGYRNVCRPLCELYKELT